MGKQQLWSAGAHGVTQHRPPTGKGENQKRGHSLVRKNTLKCDCCLPQLSEGIRVWDIAAGENHTLLLADGDCSQPIIYYSGQQVKEEMEEEVCTKEQPQAEAGKDAEQLVEGGGYTKQPVLLPFCMNVRTQQLMNSSSVTMRLCQIKIAGMDVNIVFNIARSQPPCGGQRKPAGINMQSKILML